MTIFTLVYPNPTPPRFRPFLRLVRFWQLGSSRWVFVAEVGNREVLRWRADSSIRLKLGRTAALAVFSFCNAANVAIGT